jgi:hypothetical protein
LIVKAEIAPEGKFPAGAQSTTPALSEHGKAVPLPAVAELKVMFAGTFCVT